MPRSVGRGPFHLRSFKQDFGKEEKQRLRVMGEALMEAFEADNDVLADDKLPALLLQEDKSTPLLANRKCVNDGVVRSQWFEATQLAPPRSRQ